MKIYLSIKIKFFISLFVSIAWGIFAMVVAEKWISDLAEISNQFISYFIIIGIAVIPGVMNAFLVISLLLDKRPKRVNHEILPDITILIAAYNEEDSILSTLESIDKQHYNGNMKVFVINDGSSDTTVDKVKSVESQYPWMELVDIKNNMGKSHALNHVLNRVTTDLVITIDGDSYLYKDALKNLVERYLSDPVNTVAVAGAVLVRNSRKNLVTKVQEWDYFHGIAAIKRLQSLYQGTLVAQGAFSLYKTKELKDAGGWPHCVGEDIVLTWALLKSGSRVGYAEDACLFTNAPETWSQFFKQRQRWSRGLIEAFKAHWQLLFKRKYITLFIWWNLLFPYMDIVYTLVLIPGIIAALFGYYLIAGPMTLIVLPMAMIINYIMFSIQNKMFTSQGLKVRNNIFGFIIYSMFYSFILQPACVFGYFKEIFNGATKNWGTK